MSVRVAIEPRERSALLFFALTFLWSWSLFGVAIASGSEWPQAPALVPWAIGALGPALVAFLLVHRSANTEGVRLLVRRTLAFRAIATRWWLAILGLAAFPNLAALILQTAALGELPDSVGDAKLTLLSPLPILAFGLAAGLAEEPGWRGYALERLAGQPLLVASLLVGVAWSLWHLPLFFIDGTFQHELAFGSRMFWWFVLQILPTSVLLAWLYVRTGRLVAAAVALHALGNAAGELLPVEGGGRWLSFAFLAGLTAAVVARDRRVFLASVARHPARREDAAARARPLRPADP